MIDIDQHIHFDGIKVDLRKYLHIGMFLNMEHSMAENEENSFLTCNLVFVSFSFDKRGEMKNHSVEIDFILLGLTDDSQL